MSEELENFKSKYRAHVQPGTRRYAVPKRLSVTMTDEPWDLNFEYENSVQIDMSKRDFETLIGMEAYFKSMLEDRDFHNYRGFANQLVEQHERELRIRNENPAVKLAYEKYQTVLRMVDSYYD
jgi:hypothetical protein